MRKLSSSSLNLEPDCKLPFKLSKQQENTELLLYKYVTETVSKSFIIKMDMAQFPNLMIFDQIVSFVFNCHSSYKRIPGETGPILPLCEMFNLFQDKWNVGKDDDSDYSNDDQRPDTADRLGRCPGVAGGNLLPGTGRQCPLVQQQLALQLLDPRLKFSVRIIMVITQTAAVGRQGRRGKVKIKGTLNN